MPGVQEEAQRRPLMLINNTTSASPASGATAVGWSVSFKWTLSRDLNPPWLYAHSAPGNTVLEILKKSLSQIPVAPP